MKKTEDYFAYWRSLTPLQYAAEELRSTPHTRNQLRKRAARVQTSNNASNIRESCYGYSVDNVRQAAAAECRGSWFALMQDAAFLRMMTAPKIRGELLAEARRSIASARQNRNVYHKIR